MNKLVVANWKQNFNVSEASHFMHRLQESTVKVKNVDVVICPSFVALHPLYRQIDHHKFKLGSQAIHAQDSSPATGEVGAPMLRGLVSYAIVGHSYRRAHFNVTDKDVGQKVASCIRSSIVPIICIGENALERAEGRTNQVIKSQLDAALSSVTTEDLKDVVITSEPVWAISTSKNHKEPLPDDITGSIAIIRNILTDRYGAKAAKNTTVLYGGSVNDSNARDYAVLDGVDGFLVGGASLDHNKFAKIINSVQNISET